MFVPPYLTSGTKLRSVKGVLEQARKEFTVSSTSPLRASRRRIVEDLNFDAYERHFFRLASGPTEPARKVLNYYSKLKTVVRSEADDLASMQARVSEIDTSRRTLEREKSRMDLFLVNLEALKLFSNHVKALGDGIQVMEKAITKADESRVDWLQSQRKALIAEIDVAIVYGEGAEISLDPVLSAIRSKELWAVIPAVLIIVTLVVIAVSPLMRRKA